MPRYTVGTKNRAGTPVGGNVIEAPDQETAMANWKAMVIEKLLTTPGLGKVVGLDATTEEEIRRELETFTWTIREVAR